MISMSEQIEREVLLSASPAEVWRALTDGDQVSEWFGAEVEMEPHRGGRVHFRFPDGTKRGAVIETFETERLLVLRWLPFEQNAQGRTQSRPSTNVRFSLRPSDRETLLVVQEYVPGLFSGESLASDPSGYSDRGWGRLRLRTRARR